jgi:RNA polymerase sigma-70 factor (ECF subfamily)
MPTKFETTLHEVRAARAGDRAALNTLFARYLPWVLDTVALRLGRRRQDIGGIEDLVQESLLDAFRSIDRFQERSEGSFRHWLARIVENNVRDQERRRRAQKRGSGNEQVFRDVFESTIEAPGVSGREATPSQVAGQHENAALVESALLQLPARTREVLILRDRCDMAFDEVAATMGLGSAESARTTYRRALQAFAAALQAVSKSP